MNSDTFKHAFSAEDLYIGLNKKLLRQRSIKKDRRKQVAASIFKDCFYNILLDIIDNNVTFVFPLKYGNYAELYMRQYSDTEFKELYKKGKFNDVDFVSSQFTGNQLKLNYRTKASAIKEKPIYVNRELKKKILEYTNNAKQYF